MCMKTVIKLVIGILSAVFALIGLVIFIVGIVFRFVLTNKVIEMVNAQVQNINFKGADEIKNELNKYISYLPDLMEVPNTVFTALIIFGIVIAAVGIIGIVSIYSENKNMLIIYIAILGVCIAVQLAVIIAYFVKRESFSDKVKESMQKSIDSKYSGYNVKNVETMAWNLVHLGFGCCGINGGGDFKNARMWGNKATIDGNDMTDLAYPSTCCKISNFTDCLRTKVSNSTLSNAKVGCWDKVANATNVYFAAADYSFSCVAGIVILLQIAILVFAIFLLLDKSPRKQTA